MSDVARKFLLSKDDAEKRQTFWNTQLGQPHKGVTERDIEPSELMKRREVYSAEVPEGVAVITAGVDVHGNRLEIEVVGWGVDEESWSIAYAILPGDPAHGEVWEQLDALLTRKFLRSDGRPFTIEAACVDSGLSDTSGAGFFALPDGGGGCSRSRASPRGAGDERRSGRADPARRVGGKRTASRSCSA